MLLLSQNFSWILVILACNLVEKITQSLFKLNSHYFLSFIHFAVEFNPDMNPNLGRKDQLEVLMIENPVEAAEEKQREADKYDDGEGDEWPDAEGDDEPDEIEDTQNKIEEVKVELIEQKVKNMK